MSSLSEGSEDTTRNKRLKLERNPLLMGSVMEIIFSNLDVDSIKSARQVNKLWNAEGVKMLINKCFIKLPSDLRVGETSSRFKLMRKFEAFLSYKSKDRSMIPNIKVNDDEDLELWKFFGVLGDQVHSLHFPHMGTETELLHKLLDLLPNLKYLTRKSKSYSSYWNKIEFRVVVSAMSKREKNQKPLLISHVILSAYTMEDIQEMQKFSACKNIKIHHLRFFTEPFVRLNVSRFEARFANNISNLLLASQNTLKKLTLSCCELLLHLLDFPILNGLTHMNLYFSEFSGQFPVSFRFSEKVPNLKKIVISCCGTVGRADNFFLNLLSKVGKSPTLKCFKYGGDFPDASVRPIFKAFPNIQVFETSITQSNKRMFRSLWKHGAKLKKIIIDMDLNRFNGRFRDLDSIVTGFSRKTVKKLKKSPKLVSYALEELEKLRIHTSILNLKELEQLTIRFLGSDDSELAKGTLAVAGDFAFKYMPKDFKVLLQVTETTVDLWKFAEVSKLQNVTLDYPEIEDEFCDESD